MPDLKFRIDVRHSATRELHVHASLTGIATDEVTLFLPTWTPGSYLVREYARHLSRVTARAADGGSLPCRKVDKNRFVVEAQGSDTIEVSYRVYGHELSVRTAHLDAERAFWTPACVLLWPVGGERHGAEITVEHTAEHTVWCALPTAEPRTLDDGARATTMRAADLDEALDSPVLVGRADVHTWQNDGVPHRIVLEGLGPITPPPTLVDDLTRIVDAAHAVFGGTLPYPDYTFLAMFTDEGYGGLEHRNSSVLLMARTALTSQRTYRDFLGLAAHELFHAWNVKRMRPSEFWRYDYEQENYTRLLWVMEGWTAYYDDLLLARAGLMSHDDYLGTMAKNLQNLRNGPGRFEQSLEESSHDAWIRLYRPDENTRNSSQNYYGNGAVVAMCLDLLIRRSSAGRHSLDDVLRELFASTFTAGRGYDQDDIYALVTRFADEQTAARLRELVTGDLDPELDDLLASVGVELTLREQEKPYLGIAFQPGSTVVASVTRDGPAYTAAIAPGDEVLAADGVRTTAGNWQSVFRAVAAIDEPSELLLARRGMILTRTVRPCAHPGTVKLRLRKNPSPEQRTAREAWLGKATSVPEPSTATNSM